MKWLELARHQFVGALTDTSPVTAQLFRAGDPVNREQEAFVYRRSIVAEMEQQILLATGCPGLVVYGRGRIGKSTVLKNLTGFLPAKVPVGYLSMQNPLAFTTLGVFCQQIAEAIQSATRGDDMLSIDCDNLPALMRLLSRYNKRFVQDGR